MEKSWKYLLLATALSFCMLSCKEDFEPEPFTYTQLLTGQTSKTWVMTGISILEDGAPTQNIPLPENDCVFDDQYVFYANDEKKYEILDAANKCAPEDPDIFLADRWSFVNAKATLEIVVPILTPEFRLPFIVKSLTDSRMVLEIFFDGGSYRFTFQALRTQE